MVDKTTSFKKRAEGRRGTSRRTTSKLLLKWRSLSLVLSLRLSASTAKGPVTRRMAKWTKVYWIYMLLMCTLLVFIATPQYLILVQLLRLVTRNGSCRIKTSWGWSDDVCWKWFQDWYDHHRTLPIHSGLVLNLNKCYLVFALSMNMIWSCLLQ